MSKHEQNIVIKFIIMLVLSAVLIVLMYDIITQGPIIEWILTHIIHDTSQSAEGARDISEQHGLF